MILANIQRYALVALLLVSLALGFGLWRSVKENGALGQRAQVAEKALSAAEEQRKKDAALLTRRQGEIASERRKSAQARAALAEALGDAPAWAGTSVPPQVQEALRGAVEGLE